MILRVCPIACAVALLLGLPANGPAEDKSRERLHQQAVEAAQQRQTRRARDLFCELAHEHPSDKPAKEDCDLWTNELDAEIKHSDADFVAAQSLLKQNDCDGAELNFSHVVEGSHVPEAQAALKEDVSSCFYDHGMKSFQIGRYDLAQDSLARVCCGSHASEARAVISDEIPAARQADDTFHSGESAFSGGQIEAAEKLFRSVTTGQFADEARNYVEKRIPELYFDRGEDAFREHRLDEAESDFRRVSCNPYAEEAAKYLHDRIPRARSTVVEQERFATAERAYAGNDFEMAQTLFSEFATDPGGSFASRAAEYLKDIHKYQQSMACGKENEQKRCPAARECYTAAATIKRDGPGNPSARLESLACAIIVPPGNDAALATGIREFQARQYNDAEVHLRDYLSQNERRAPDKIARAHFYLGASKASRYYLDPRGEQLLQEAQSEFCTALRTPGFTLSSAEMTYVSPRIIEAYRNSCH